MSIARRCSSFAVRSIPLLVPLLGAGLPLRADPASPAPPPPSAEVRGIWVTRWDFRTEADVRQIVANCASIGLNRIYFQVRGRSDAFYRSELEPWGEEIGGRDPGFDPLATAVAESRRQGVELHAWVNVLAGWKGTRPPRSRRHVFHTHPDWFLLDRYGKRHLLDSHYTIVNPCRREVREHIRKVMIDITSRYSVDGLHLDYIRFIATGARARQAVPYDNHTLHDFRARTGGFPVRHPAEWDAFRREAVDRLVAEISSDVRRTRPGVRLSAAVLKDFDRARSLYFQDAARWVERGWVAEVVPMNYGRDSDGFLAHARDSLARTGGGRCLPGIGVYLLKGTHELSCQIDATRRLGTGGYCLFAYTSFFPSPSHASSVDRAARRLRISMREAVLRLNERAVAGGDLPTVGSQLTAAR